MKKALKKEGQDNMATTKENQIIGITGHENSFYPPGNTDLEKMDANDKFQREAVEKCLEYSDEPERLKDWLKTAPIKIVKNPADKNPAWNDKGKPTINFEVTIGHYSFTFYGSIHDTEAWNGQSSSLPTYGKHTMDEVVKAQRIDQRKRPAERRRILTGVLYSVLACCSAESYCPIRFSEFCSDFGYDEDSRSAHALWERCLDHSQQLKEVIPEEIAEVLPS